MLLVLQLTLVSCTPYFSAQPVTSDNLAKNATTDAETFAGLLVQVLRDHNMKELSGYVCVDKGLSFSPYAYIDRKRVNIQSSDLVSLWQDDPMLNWGDYDGSGEPINLKFRTYFRTFVYSVDYAGTKQIAVNKRIAGGNTVDNIRSVFPDASIVEYHVQGVKPEYQGMDWRSLLLVLEKNRQGSFCLVAIVNDQWTI
jgi:hypothetical protein